MKERSPDVEAKASLLTGEEVQSSRSLSFRQVLWWKSHIGLRLFVFLNICLLITSIFVFYSSAKGNPCDHTLPLRNEDLKRVSAYSPLLNMFNITTSKKTVNGTLFFPENPALSRQFPSPAVEDFWDHYEKTDHRFPITRSDVLRMGHDPEISTRFPLSAGLGDDAYMANLDSTHQVHCLNSLRKVAFRDYKPFPTKLHMTMDELYWIHMAHCVDILYQALSCQANTELMTYEWVKTQENPFPQMSLQRNCHDFEGQVAWQEENSVPAELWQTMSRADDPGYVRDRAQEKGYYDFFNLEPPPA